MKLALVPMNPTVGALEGNAELAAGLAHAAHGRGAGVVLLPELCLTGYPPRDLLVQSGFLRDARDAALGLCRELPRDAFVVVGCPWPDEHGSRLPTNRLLVFHAGSIIQTYDKRLLPTYDVFDEHRYFRPGDGPVVFDAGPVRFGLSVCEDLWKAHDARTFGRYEHETDPIEDLVASGAQVVLNPSASPFVLGKHTKQRELLAQHAAQHSVVIAGLNQLGGHDDLVFDGSASVHVPTGGGGAALVGVNEPFSGNALDIELDAQAWGAMRRVSDPFESSLSMDLLLDALVLGVRDYCAKSGFDSAVLGLSGGIDSALTACIAAKALGPEQVHGVAMPSRYSSQGSVVDARALAGAIGCKCSEFPIDEPHDVLEQGLGRWFSGLGLDSDHGVTEENVQSRIRGLIVMALSNKTGALLLTTGNKSELAVGYCTLYGDMNGGLAVLSDVSKQQVFALSRHINTHWERLGFQTAPIPESTLTKPPSAELRPDQLDSDSLPPYEVLDEIIERYVEHLEDPRLIVAETGFDEAVVARIVRLIDVNEFKRKQAPIGIKVSSIAFGRGRRRPIVNGYRPERGLGTRGSHQRVSEDRAAE